jgi:hypothetical protein
MILINAASTIDENFPKLTMNGEFTTTIKYQLFIKALGFQNGPQIQAVMNAQLTDGV